MNINLMMLLVAYVSKNGKLLYTVSLITFIPIKPNENMPFRNPAHVPYVFAGNTHCTTGLRPPIG